MTTELNQPFGIVANVVETDRVFRTGAKCWYVTTRNGRPMFIGMSRGGRTVEKYAPLHRFANFRAAWVPDNVRDRVVYCLSKSDAQTIADHLNRDADESRAAHPNRRK